MVSVFYFTPLPGFFSPFPLGTCSLSVTREYLALRDGPRGFRQDYTCLAVLRIPYRVHNILLTGLSPTKVRLPNRFNYVMNLWLCIKVLQPQLESWFGLFPFRSPLLRKSIFLSSPPVTKMFQFTGLLSYNYVFIIWYLRITIGGLPHSEISGSKLTYSSPKHIVVRHVLHLLLVPRHPPSALSNLITIWFNYPNLMRYFNVMYASYTWLPHYQVFKEQFLRDDLSKLSKMFLS